MGPIQGCPPGVPGVGAMADTFPKCKPFLYSFDFLGFSSRFASLGRFVGPSWHASSV
jgi:hypothetical protein